MALRGNDEVALRLGSCPRGPGEESSEFTRQRLGCRGAWGGPCRGAPLEEPCIDGQPPTQKEGTAARRFAVPRWRWMACLAELACGDKKGTVRDPLRDDPQDRGL
ncbi:hypothetical protein NDU88_002337 [Pleurodeles waltl]|uniref:Uncharacterized protein n=1 Tax=Pleurodeles waltl TaxID=8319 RepID=A0AAV7WS16_PLEWA|nr:hypothetical protein NDU88_002337 [Pleurodeles waltl]